MYRLCPACTNRRNQLVDPECVACDGHGRLQLGEGALALYTADVVAEAVVLGLEAKAREADQMLTLSDDRGAVVREAVSMMLTAGVLAPQESLAALTLPPAPPPYRRTRKRDTAGRYAQEFTPSAVAEHCVQTELFPLDETLAHAEVFVYQEEDRPNARGLPVLSANGHPSHLARVADPMEPGNDTMAECRLRHSEHLRAQALVEAIPEAVRIKNRRQGLKMVAI